MKKPVLSLTKKDFKVDTFRSGGKGGQHQNTTNSGARITHIETGYNAECREHRSFHQNKREAFTKLCNDRRFRMWLKEKTLGIVDTEKKVEEMMKPENLKVEVRKNKKWEKEC